MMKCLQCNKMVKDQQFCNDLCKTRYNNKLPRNCLVCGVYMGLFSIDSRRKTCSNKCRGLRRKVENQVENTCLNCHVKFYTSKSRSKTLCSNKCRRIYTSQPEHIRSRTKSSKLTLIRKYATNPLLLQNTIAKSKKTKLEKYGNENYVNSVLARQTKLKKYGDENYNNQEKLKKTMLDKYGVSNFNQTSEFKQNFFNKVISRITLAGEYTPLFSFNKYSGVDVKYPFLCNKCNSQFMASVNNGQNPYCKHCNTVSVSERELYLFIKSLIGDNILLQDRTVINPFELDIVIPNKKFAIEYNGVYWHSELNGKSRFYHVNKTKLCEQVGVKLLHITDNEWNTSKKIIESIIQTQLVPEKNIKIFARKCEVKPISTKVSEQFLDLNHLQGNAHASIRLGLFYADELVQVLTFSRSRFSSQYEYELVRLCSKINHTIVGGSQKLFTHFIKKFQPRSIVTFADRRFFSGKIYNTLGFSFTEYTLPNYYYFRSPKKLESRLHYQKHKLQKTLSKFDPQLSEWENMKNNGYDRIWDCGNAKYVWVSIKNPLG